MKFTFSKQAPFFTKTKIGLLWILLNVIGLLFIYLFVGKVKPYIIFGLPSYSPISWLISYILNALFLSVIQTIFLFFFFKRNIDVKLSIINIGISFLLIQIFEQFVMWLIYSFLVPKIILFGYMIAPMTALDLFLYDLQINEVITVLVLSAIIGIIRGGIFALFYPNNNRSGKPKKARRIVQATSYLSCAFVFDSLLLTLSKYRWNNIYDHRVIYIIVVISGLSYGLATLQ
jgi:hypothetical protein